MTDQTATLMKIRVYGCREVRGGGKCLAVSWNACLSTDRKWPALPAICHHCSLTWTHEKHQWKLISNCRTSLLIFQSYTHIILNCVTCSFSRRTGEKCSARLVVLFRRMKGDISHYRTMDSIKLRGPVTCLENQVVCFVFSWFCLFFKAFFFFFYRVFCRISLHLLQFNISSWLRLTKAGWSAFIGWLMDNSKRMESLQCCTHT